VSKMVTSSQMVAACDNFIQPHQPCKNHLKHPKWLSRISMIVSTNNHPRLKEYTSQFRWSPTISPASNLSTAK
jgi:hypothetical protein